MARACARSGGPVSLWGWAVFGLAGRAAGVVAVCGLWPAVVDVLLRGAGVSAVLGPVGVTVLPLLWWGAVVLVGATYWLGGFRGH